MGPCSVSHYTIWGHVVYSIRTEVRSRWDRERPGRSRRVGGYEGERVGGWEGTRVQRVQGREARKFGG